MMLRTSKYTRTKSARRAALVAASAASLALAGLLGASPGASTAAPIMLEVLERCFADRWTEWQPALSAMVPSFGAPLADDPAEALSTMTRTATALSIVAPPRGVNA